MKYKVSELEGNLLDAAVTKAEGQLAERGWSGMDGQCLTYSSAWKHGGPVLEREQITVVASTGYDCEEPLEWSATVGAFSHYIDESLPFAGRGGVEGQVGPTPLVAAMRAYVAKTLGEEIELP